LYLALAVVTALNPGNQYHKKLCLGCTISIISPLTPFDILLIHTCYIRLYQDIETEGPIPFEKTKTLVPVTATPGQKQTAHASNPIKVTIAFFYGLIPPSFQAEAPTPVAFFYALQWLQSIIPRSLHGASFSN